MSKCQAHLEDDFKIATVAAVVVAEEDAAQGIGGVGVHGEGVEVVGDVEGREREADGVFRVDLKPS
jgi:hypothetical protein